MPGYERLSDLEILRGISSTNAQLVRMVKSLKDSVKKEGAIFATICTMKLEMPEAFENALITFLKYGVDEEDEKKNG